MWGKKKIDALVPALDCEQSLKRGTRARKSSEASESRGEAWKEAGKEYGKDSSARLSPVSLSANSLSPVLPSLDSTD